MAKPQADRPPKNAEGIRITKSQCRGECPVCGSLDLRYNDNSSISYADHPEWYGRKINCETCGAKVVEKFLIIKPKKGERRTFMYLESYGDILINRVVSNYCPTCGMERTLIIKHEDEDGDQLYESPSGKAHGFSRGMKASIFLTSV